jgi:hypothetical protein
MARLWLPKIGVGDLWLEDRVAGNNHKFDITEARACSPARTSG